jgi:hypothetical protein
MMLYLATLHARKHVFAEIAYERNLNKIAYLCPIFRQDINAYKTKQT